MSIIRLVLLMATIITSDPLFAGDVKGWPGWKQDSFDESWDKAKARHNLPANHPKPFTVRGMDEGPAATECDPKEEGDPKVYDIGIFPDQFKAQHKITDNADLNTPENIESLAKTLTHELYHQCLRNAGLPCAPEGDAGELCEELAVDFATLNKLCKEVGEKCEELCQKKAAADDPPTAEQQEEIDKLEEEIAATCKAIEEIRDKYNKGETSEKWAEQLCYCAGWPGAPNDCPDVVLPPQVPNPNPGSDLDGGVCDYPDGEEQEIMPKCDKCDDCGCQTGDPPEEEDDDGGGEN